VSGMARKHQVAPSRGIIWYLTCLRSWKNSGTGKTRGQTAPPRLTRISGCQTFRAPPRLRAGLGPNGGWTHSAMNKGHLQRITVVLACAVAGYGQHKNPLLLAGYRYSAAFISTISAPPGHAELVVFPLHGKAFKIPIRSAGGGFLYALDGKALYGSCTPYPDNANPALCKIDLYSGDVTPVPGSTGPHIGGPGSMSLSASGDRIFFTGLDRLFERTLPDGMIKTKMIFPQADKHAWLGLNLSPDGGRAVAIHGGRVELINIAHGTVEPLRDDLLRAAWSPDGRWLAAVEKGEHGRTVLMDAKSLARRR
jgi:hypothetical protein